MHSSTPLRLIFRQQLPSILQLGIIIIVPTAAHLGAAAGGCCRWLLAKFACMLARCGCLHCHPSRPQPLQLRLQLLVLGGRLRLRLRLQLRLRRGLLLLLLTPAPAIDHGAMVPCVCWQRPRL